MARVALLVFAVFMLLTVLRGLRIFLNAFLQRGRPTPRERLRREEEMVRDPVCGRWIDRRLALPVRRSGVTVAVCSDECRKSLEAAG